MLSKLAHFDINRSKVQDANWSRQIHACQNGDDKSISKINLLANFCLG